MTRRRPRWIWIVPLTVLLLLLATLTAVWAITCQRLDAGAHELAAANGWSLASGPARWRGWPTAAEIALPDVVLRAGPTLPPLVWTAPQARLRLALRNPTRLTVSGLGAQTIAWADRPPVPFNAHDLHVTLDLSGRAPPRAELAALDAATSAGPLHVDAGVLRFPPDGLTAELAGLALPEDSTPTAPRVDSLRFTLHLAPPLPAAVDPAESARRWRALGGRLDLTDAALRWAALSATGHATVTLDPALQPIVIGELRETGLGATLDALAQAGVLARPTALAAQAMLAILAAPAGGGPVTLPLAMANGVVSVARIPLLRLAPLAW